MMSTIQAVSTKQLSWANIAGTKIVPSPAVRGEATISKLPEKRFGDLSKRRVRLMTNKVNDSSKWDTLLSRDLQKEREEKACAEEREKQLYDEMCREAKELPLSKDEYDDNVCSYCRRCGRRGGPDMVGLGACCDGYWATYM